MFGMQVEVVSAIDGKKLNATLGWIVKNIEELKVRFYGLLCLHDCIPAVSEFFNAGHTQGKDSGGKPDLEAQLKEQAEKLAALQKAHDEVNQSLKSRIDDLEKALGDLSDRTAGLEDKASAAENKLQEVDPEKLGELSKIDPEALRDAVERASQLPSSLSVLPGRLAALEAQAAALPRGILPAVETPPQPQSAPAGEPVPAHEADCRVDELAVALPELARRVESLEKAQKDTDDSLGPLRGLPDKVGRLSEEVEGAAARLNAAEGAVKEAHDVAAESLGAAEGAAKRAHEANERVSDIEDQMSQLRCGRSVGPQLGIRVCSHR